MEEKVVLDAAKGNLFQQIVSLGKEALDKVIEAAKVPTRRKAIAREFEAKLDAHNDELVSIEARLLDYRTKIADYKVDQVWKLLSDREGHINAIKLLKEERFIMLGTPTSEE